MVIDAAALAALQTLPENPPILPSAPTREEYDWSVYGAAQDAWVWIYDLKPKYLSSQSVHEPMRQAWIRVAPPRLTGLQGSHLMAKKRRGQWSGCEFFDLSSEVWL
ncbi:hypothetical protein E8E14_004156 [Neopestalotiopsis sp. 37M]|nr:hypothetical protein E8E14_004156 [Neopestalotiopsis sp. 37M]